MACSRHRWHGGGGVTAVAGCEAMEEEGAAPRVRGREERSREVRERKSVSEGEGEV